MLQQMSKKEAFQNWIDHLMAWDKFLKFYINSLKEEDAEGNLGEIIKLDRQLETINNVRFGVVASPQLFEKLIFPESIEINNTEEIESFYDESLVESQKEAVRMALNTEDLCLIQGPPGTGKTTVITEICLQILLKKSDSRILLASETHVAVNNVLEKLYELLDDFNPLRINNRDYNVGEDIKESSVDSYLTDYYSNLMDIEVPDRIIENIKTIFEDNYRSLVKDLILSKRVVGITCNKIGAYRFEPNDDTVDYVIIDEVSKATLPEIIMPLSRAKKAILVGDPQQLPPIFCKEDRDIMEESQTDEVEKYKYIDNLYDRAPDFACAMLKKQFRMTNEIGDLISYFFYNNKLENGLQRSIPGSAVWVDYKPERKWPLEDKEKIYNNDEIDILKEVLKEEYSKEPTAKNIAIIAPYRDQIKKLRNELDPDDYPHYDIQVDTVDAFQGKDADCVIFSITRTHGTMRFFSDPRRLNVALSRAKDKLIIIGSAEYTKEHRIFREMIERIKYVQHIDY